MTTDGGGAAALWRDPLFTQSLPANSTFLATLKALLDTEYAIATSGTRTPALTGMAIGTGGSALNTQNWSYVGPRVGVGQLKVDGTILFGTAGVTLPGAAVTIDLPTGYSVADVSSAAWFLEGLVFYTLASGNATGPMRVNGASTIRPTIFNAIARLPDQATNAYVWANGDGMRYRFSARVNKV